MQLLDEWSNELRVRLVQGSLILTNIKLDCLRDRPSHELSRQLLAQLAERLAADPKLTANPQLISEVVASDAPAYVAKGEPAATPETTCSRVLDATEFIRYNLTREAKEELVGGISDHVSSEQLDQVGRSFGDVICGYMSNKAGFAWVTRAETIEGARSRALSTGDGDIATRVRDVLGLSHHFVGTRLVEIRYPPSVAQNLPLAAPTFVEGGCGKVFRSRLGPDQWGRAVELGSWSDGGCEAVHLKLELSAAFSLHDLGDVTSDHAIDYEAILGGIPDRWSAHDSLAAYLDD